MTQGTGRSTLSRRVVLGFGMGAPALVLAGCGVRLEEDAPDLPFVPRRTKVAGESELVALAADCLDLATAGGKTGEPVGAALAALHLVQAHTLHDQLRAAGVPSSVLSPSPSTSASAGGATTVSREELHTAEGRLLSASDRFAGLAPTFAPAVLSLLAQRWAGVRWLDQPDSPGPSAPSAAAAPTPAASTGAVEVLSTGYTAEALTALRGTCYLLEVLGPHAADPERALTSTTLTRLRLIDTAVTKALGTQAPAAVLGVPYPSDLTTPSSQRAMIADALTQTINAYGRGLTSLLDKRLRDSLPLVPAELGELADWARQWGVALTPFPGLA